ncbi:MAG: RluA family pseudouridine synthase [Clostridia bacterium]|nr:RluA family pseudouridine synthase [Clostridia bacterium]
MQTIEIRRNDAGQRVDKFLQKSFPNLPAAMMYKAIRRKDIKLNGKRCEISSRLSEGDILTLYLKDEFFEKNNQERYDFLKAPNKLSILYEDENILLLDKKPGLLCHPDDHYYFDSLLARLTRYLYEKGEYDPKDEQSFAPALANRIDRNTGGIVIAAKNAEALRILNLKIRNRELQKLYLCVVHGRLPKKEALLEGFLEKNEDQNRVYISDVPREGALTIRTKYRVLEERGGDSLLEVDLLTGRTHQIRAHLAHIGHPIAGDGKYGKNAQNRGGGYPYQALCSYKLTFRFETDAGLLDYLNGRSFEVPDVWFLPVFYGRKKE